MTTTNETFIPGGGAATLPREENWLRPPSQLEKAVGPEWARLIKGILTNPLSVLGIVIIIGFIAVGLFARTLAPAPTANWDPYSIPRDGFSPEPQPPGTVWEKNVPARIPAWYALTGNEEWVHLLGTTGGQYDIWYAMVWGTRTALIAGTFVVAVSAIFGMLIVDADCGDFCRLPWPGSGVGFVIRFGADLWPKYLAGRHCFDCLWLDGLCSFAPRRHSGQ
jgi:hypothetical protein